MRKPTQSRAPVQGLDGVGGQGAKAHARDVEQGQVVGLRALAAPDADAKRRRVGLHGLQRVGQPFRVRAVHVLDAAKATFVVLYLGAGVHHGALVA